MNLTTLPTHYPELSERRTQKLPQFPIPDGFESSFGYLVHLAELPKQLDTEEYHDRLSIELDVIERNGYADYFLMMYDLVNAARQIFDCHTGPGRGSSAGSLVCYLLGITKVDPIRHHLLHERFVQPDRAVLPDIDIDFESDEIREHLLHYLQQKYGKDHVAHIITYDHDQEGIIKGYGIHACGLAIADGPLNDYSPMTMVDNTIVTALDGHNIEGSGVVKLDILHLSAIESIFKAVRTLNAEKGINIDIYSIPMDDAATLEAFRNADTDDIFMFQGKGMREILRQMPSLTFDDLVAINSMYRPGPDELLPDYIDRKNGTESATYPIPCMEKYLKETYGILLYQEQLMLLLMQLAGFVSADSNQCRMAIGKKDTAQLPFFKSKFVEGGISNGHPKGILDALWDDWCRKGPYLFNKSHAVCYTFIAYQQMYLKVHYRFF